MRHVIRQHLRKAVIVTLKSATAFRGVLLDADKDALVLRNAEVLEVGGDRVPMAIDGEIVVLRADVAYMQFV